MPRHTYRLQDESIKVLKGYEKCIADELNVTDKYIYAILGGAETDPFARFLEIYAAAVRAGAATRHWDERLATVRERNERHEALCIHQETAKFAQESADVSIAHIEGKDAHTILREAREAIAQGKKLERAALDEIEAYEYAVEATVGQTRRPHSDQRNKATAVTFERAKGWGKNGRGLK